ncbi:hypothetical protein GCM10009655_15680 [Rhodoglobus aureus]|uniref:Uncharacterized protein n=1 Tax=Rhodoglobus aureus TaxID=191497 RepID=A0ABN1VQ77_9MICO
MIVPDKPVPSPLGAGTHAESVSAVVIAMMLTVPRWVNFTLSLRETGVHAILSRIGREFTDSPPQIAVGVPKPLVEPQTQ